MESMRSIGGWETQRRLGRGDFGAVYLGKRGDEVGALKLGTSDTKGGRERLRIERDALTQLDHPNIPRLLDSGSEDGTDYLVMSLAAGETLQDRVAENLRHGRLYGDIETLQLLTGALSALAHLHARGLVHRDIKDANVMHDTDGERLTLIDFGFCKEANKNALRLDDSFWRAGAARFSPPSKLEDPGKAVPSHDVFAIGVLAYKMLTARYPWPDIDGGIGRVREARLNHPVDPVTEHNTFVLGDISYWVSQLLELEDNRRPSAQTALDSAEEIIRTASETPLDVSRRGQIRIRYEHVIRDPIHRDIRLTDYELRILNTNEMQRLRSIKQLGLTNLVYPGADHSRLSHSIGCLARVEQLLRTIEDQQGLRFDPDLRLTARLYALTHDVSHIPFGHTIEDELGLFQRHDENRPRIRRLVGGSSELGDRLRETQYGRLVLDQLLSAKTEATFVDLVSGVTGADVLDYIDRDAHYCGLDHKIDSAIFRQFRVLGLTQQSDRRLVSLVGGKYGIRVDREFAVETILKERYGMFLKVYTHSAKAAASALLSKALYASLLEGKKPELRERQIEWMGDEVLIDTFCRSRRAVVQWAGNQLRQRRLPRGVYRGIVLDRTVRDVDAYSNKRNQLRKMGLMEPKSRHELEVRLAKAAGISPHLVMIYCPPAAPGFQQVEHWVTRTEQAAPTQQGDSVSAEIARKHLGLWEAWVFVAETKDEGIRATLADAAQGMFGMENMINVNRRQDRLF